MPDSGVPDPPDAAPPTAASPSAPAALTCRRCGYNLFQQPLIGKCPECGLAVQSSHGAYYLRHCDPAWVRRLSDGLALLLAAAVLALLAQVYVSIRMVLSMSLAAGGAPSVPSASLFRDATAQGLLGQMAGLIVALGGIFLFTARQPNAGGAADDDRPLRWTLRGSAMLILISLLAVAPVITLPARVSGATYAWAAVANGIVQGVLMAVLVVAFIRRLWLLLGRIPSPGLVSFAKVAYWATLLSMLAALALSSATMLQNFALFEALHAGNVPNWATNMPIASATAPASAPAAGAMPMAGFATSAVGGLIGCVTILVAIADFVLALLSMILLRRVGREAQELRAAQPGP